MPAYSWLILDADGTLFDFHQAEAAALDITPRQLGMRIPSHFAATYHAINASLWQAFEDGRLRAQDVRAERFRRLFSALSLPEDPAAFSEAFLKNLVSKTALYAGALPLLAKLKDRLGMVLLTNGFADVQRARIAQLGLHDTFDHVLISEEIGAAKPDRAAFDHAFTRMGNPEKSCVLMMGDSLSSDIRGGQDYGIDTCWFNPEGHALPADVHPTYVIARLEEAVELLFPGGMS